MLNLVRIRIIKRNIKKEARPTQNTMFLVRWSAATKPVTLLHNVRGGLSGKFDQYSAIALTDF